MKAEELLGIWKYATFEVGGQVRSQCQVERMAHMILIAEPLPGGWDGIWGIVTYGYEGGRWSEDRLLSYCRFTVLDPNYVMEEFKPDFYFWAGGKFRVSLEGPHAAIDFQQHWRGQDLPSSLQYGIYRLDDGRLYLCLGSEGDPRPHSFNSEDHSDQSLGKLIRVVSDPS